MISIIDFSSNLTLISRFYLSKAFNDIEFSPFFTSFLRDK